MSVATVRAAIAAALSTVSGVTVHAYPSPNLSGTGTGWMVVRGGTTASYGGQLDIEFGAVVLLGQDDAQAEVCLDTWVGDLITAWDSAMPTADLSAEASTVAVPGGTALMLALILTGTVEV